jgi:drug/metabolite transporter (DMT)-like permease
VKDRSLGRWLVLAAALLWSLGGLGIKLVQADGLAIAGFRCLFALPVILLWVATFSPPQRRGIFSAFSSVNVWVAAIGYAVTVSCFALANKWTFAANAILIQYSAPIWVALLAWRLLGERIRPLDWGSIAAALCGLGIIFSQQLGGGNLRGDLLALVSGLGFAITVLFLRLATRSGGAGPGGNLGADHSLSCSAASILLGNLLTALAWIPFMWASHPDDAAGWWVLGGLGVFQIGLSYILFSRGVSRLAALESTLLAFVEPLLNPIWVLLGTGERPTLSVLLGGFLILLAVVIPHLAGSSRPVEAQG